MGWLSVFYKYMNPITCKLFRQMTTFLEAHLKDSFDESKEKKGRFMGIQ